MPQFFRDVFSFRKLLVLTALILLTTAAIIHGIDIGTEIKKILAIIFSVAAAVFWFTAAIINTPLPMAYASGPPKHVISKLNAQSWCNSLGAMSAALATIFQSS